MALTFKTDFPGIGSKENTGRVSDIDSSAASSSNIGVYLNALRSLNETPTNTSIYTEYGMPYIQGTASSYTRGYYNGVTSTKTDTISMSKFASGWSVLFYFSPTSVPDGTGEEYQTIFQLSDFTNTIYFMLTSTGVAIYSKSASGIIASEAMDISANMNLMMNISFVSGTGLVCRILDLDASNPKSALGSIAINLDQIGYMTLKLNGSAPDALKSDSTSCSLCKFAYIAVYGGINADGAAAAYYLFMICPMKFVKSVVGSSLNIYSYCMVKGQSSYNYNLLSDIFNSCVFDDNYYLAICSGTDVIVSGSFSNAVTLTVNGKHEMTTMPLRIVGPLYSLLFKDSAVIAASSTIATYNISMQKYPSIDCNFKYNNSIVDNVVYYEDGEEKNVKYVNTVDSDGNIQEVYTAPAEISFDCSASSLDGMYIQRVSDWAGNTRDDPALYGFYYSAANFTNVKFKGRLREKWKIHTSSVDRTVTITGKTVYINGLIGTDYESCGYATTSLSPDIPVTCKTVVSSGTSCSTGTSSSGGITTCTTTSKVSIAG